MQNNPADWVMPTANYASTRYSDAGADQQGQCRRPAGRLDLLDRRAARPRRRPAGDRRRDVHPHAVPQHRLRARPERRRPGDLEVRAEAGPERDPGDVLRHGQPRRRLRRRQDLPAPGRHHAGGARRRRPARWSWTGQERRSRARARPAPPRRWSSRTRSSSASRGGEFGVRGHLTAYNIDDGKLVWRGYSTGPDDETLMDPEKTTHLGKPVGKDSGTATWEGDQWKIGGGTTWGWYSVRSRAQPDLLRHRQSRHLEPGAAPRRQPLVDDHLRARRRHRHGEVGLPDDAPRRVGL